MKNSKKKKTVVLSAHKINNTKKEKKNTETNTTLLDNYIENFCYDHYTCSNTKINQHCHLDTPKQTKKKTKWES